MAKRDPAAAEGIASNTGHPATLGKKEMGGRKHVCSLMRMQMLARL